MAGREEMKALVGKEIDSHADEIIGVARAVWATPEPGFREERTSRYISQKLRDLGIPHRGGIALTGIKGYLSGEAGPGPTVAVLGELDSLIVPGHPEADPRTGAVHACGHHGQLGMLIGVALGLQARGVLKGLCGRVALMAVPAEEYIEIEWRDELRRQGKVQFLGGKPEFIRLGEFDDVDMAMMTHVTSESAENPLTMSHTSNGIVAKRIQFLGRAAHAGSAPWAGINALNAAMIALQAIHSQRETFKDQDTIRVHPIITQGGTAVNSVPADVRMETFVRGRTTQAIADADAKVDRCLRAGAMAVGGKVRIVTLPGYMPMVTNPHMADLWRQNAATLVGEENVGEGRHRTASTDMGDVMHIMPAIHPFSGGAVGNHHGADFYIKDWDLAVIKGAKAMALTVVDLLAEGAAKALDVKARSAPSMTKEQYLAFMQGIFKEKVYEE
ncbi:MAG: amidohydrolase [Chloroflexi bacterium]|nr:amidohydrolase [Chloroflexota bacterium]